MQAGPIPVASAQVAKGRQVSACFARGTANHIIAIEHKRVKQPFKLIERLTRPSQELLTRDAQIACHWRRAVQDIYK